MFPGNSSFISACVILHMWCVSVRLTGCCGTCMIKSVSCCAQVDRKLRVASAASEHHAAGWGCSRSARCSRFFCYDLPGGRLGCNCPSKLKLNHK
jgi:hypothetical protein